MNNDHIRRERAEYERRGGHRDVYRWFSAHDPRQDRANALLGLIGGQPRTFFAAPARRRER